MMGYLSETKLLLTMLKHEGMVFLRTGVQDNCASKDCPYTIECEGLDINTIAYNLDQLEDSVLVCYHGDKPEDDGDTEWIRLVYGNGFGELVADYSMGLQDKFAHLFDYMDLEFEEIMQNMGYENLDVVDLIDENKRLRKREATFDAFIDSLDCHNEHEWMLIERIDEIDERLHGGEEE